MVCFVNSSSGSKLELSFGSLERDAESKRWACRLVAALGEKSHCTGDCPTLAWPFTEAGDNVLTDKTDGRRDIETVLRSVTMTVHLMRNLD